MTQATQKLIWNGASLTVYEWSRLDLGAMLARRPAIQLVNEAGLSVFESSLLPQMPRLYLVDGSSLSVQAGDGLYSTPRANTGPFTHVEVGYPSENPPETWRGYADDEEKPTNTIYSYIPLPLVLLYIGAHGGIDVDKTFAGYEFKIR